MSITRTALLICSIAIFVGCKSSSSQPRPKDKEARDALATLNVRVDEASDNFNKTVQVAGRKIARVSTAPEVDRIAVMWQEATYTACQRARLNRNPYVAFLDLWTMALQRQEFMATGDGKELFGPDLQPIAVAANDRMVQYFEKVGKEVFPDEFYEQVLEDVNEFAAEHPMDGFIREWRSGITEKQSKKSFGWFSKLTSPFDIGVKDTAASISEVSHSVDEVSDVVQHLPQLARWNAELMIIDMETNPTVISVREDVDGFSTAFASIAKTAEDLPRNLQEQVSKTLEESNETVKLVNTGIDGVEKTVTGVNTAMDKGAAMVEGVKDAIGETKEPLATVERTTELMGPLVKDATKFMEVAMATDPNAPPRDPNRPTDLDNLAAMAASFEKVAPDLRAVVTEVTGLMETEEIPAMNKATAEVADLIDLVFARAIMLIVIAVACLLAYRFAVVRFLPKTG
jgi:archaellum component FlaC